MLFVDAGNNAVGIGVSDPAGLPLHLKVGSGDNKLRMETANKDAFVMELKDASGDLHLGTNTTAGALVIADAGAATFTSTVTATGVNAFGGNGTVSAGSDGGGGNFGFIRWNDSENSINLGHSYGSTFNENVKVQNTGTVVINDGAQTAADFRVEGDSNTHLLFVDAGSNFVGINKSTRVSTCDMSINAGSNPGIQSQNLTTGSSNLILDVRSNGTSIIGEINATNTATQFNTSSDYRLKENVETLKDGLDRLNQLKPVQFTWTTDGSLSEGFIAHEVEYLFPDAVSGEKDAVDEEGNIAPQQVDYGRITPLLVKAIQEQQEQIEELKTEIAKLKGE